MHELSIALNILDFVEEETARRNTRIAAVHLRLGPLSGVVKQALASAYDLAREGTGADQAELVIEEVPLVVFCPGCQADRPLASPQELCCPACGTPAPEIVGGRELEIVAVEIEP